MGVYLDAWGISNGIASMDYRVLHVDGRKGDAVARDELVSLVRAAPVRCEIHVIDRGARVIINEAPDWFRDDDGLPLEWPDLIERCRKVTSSHRSA